MPTIPTLVAELRAGLDGVTPGPWAAQRDKRRMQPWSVVGDGNKAAVADISQALRGDFAEPAANAQHIARCSPDNIRLLLDWNDELVSWLRAALNMVDGDGMPPNWDGMRSALARLTEAKD